MVRFLPTIDHKQNDEQQPLHSKNNQETLHGQSVTLRIYFGGQFASVVAVVVQLILGDLVQLCVFDHI